MGEKEWVDLPDFAEALRIARRRQKARSPMVPSLKTV
jgi:hypothetical protein